jgi:PadR family transcriptional regulator
MDNERFFAGLIRLHVLYHASQEPVFGLEMIRELRRHGYELSAGTLYPLLHNMEQSGYLSSTKKLANGRFRRFYRATPMGRRALREGRAKVRELFGELFNEENDSNEDPRGCFRTKSVHRRTSVDLKRNATQRPAT